MDNACPAVSLIFLVAYLLNPVVGACLWRHASVEDVSDLLYGLGTRG